MAADEEPNPLKLPNDSPVNRWASRAFIIIAAVLLSLVVLMCLNVALGSPGCTKPRILTPGTQPK